MDLAPYDLQSDDLDIDLLNFAAMADEFTRQTVVADYLREVAANTRRRQAAGLIAFADFLAQGSATLAADLRAFADDVRAYPNAAPHAGCWAGVTHGLVKQFFESMLRAGYAVSTANVRLSTLKTYARLAFTAGVIGEREYLLIKGITGKGRKAAVRIDEGRAQTRRENAKKREAVVLTHEQAEALKAHDLDTAQGRRDALLMALLLDHGMRVSEAALLTVGDIDLDAGVMRFYRPKLAGTDKEYGEHELSQGALAALRAYFEAGDAPVFDDAPLLRSSRKGGALTDAGMSERAITKRVRDLGAAMGIGGLSAHDCRHTLATRYGQNPERYPMPEVLNFFGWTSPSMFLTRYAKPNEVSDLARR